MFSLCESVLLHCSSLLTMKLLILFCFFNIPLISMRPDSFDDLWISYKVKYKKFYDEKYEGVKRKVWEKNAQMIAKHNLEADMGLHSYRLELNKFSDMTSSELDVYRKCLSHGSHIESDNYFKCDRKCFASLPKYVDWREKNLVTPVKDQKNCGSCWAFSSTGALEGQNKRKRGTLVSLSEQNLVDCSWKQGNAGCDGGWMQNAFQYVIDNNGIDTEKSYPYKGKDGHCKFLRSGVGANCTSYVNIRKGSEKDLQAAVANIGPISVAIYVNDGFMFYKEGIYYDKFCLSFQLDHAVLVVGYGTVNGTDYWIVKNSWSTSWGMKGYILMARNAHNMCGIASAAAYPVI